MNLFETMNFLLCDWKENFSQERTAIRILPLVYGLLLSPPKHTTSAAICAFGRQFDDWSADYRVFSRSPWDPQSLFDPVIDHAIPLLPPYPAPIIAAMDDGETNPPAHPLPT
jgi:hypothetical protein